MVPYPGRATSQATGRRFGARFQPASVSQCQDDSAKFNFDAGGPCAPDLGVWLGIPDLAPEIIAYFYNKNIAAHSGRLEGVLDLKEVPEPVWGTLTRDFEMSFADKLQQ